jgi:histidyl-tRNA synthetase
MIPDAEIVSMVCSILSKLDVGEFTIKVLRLITACRHLG